MPKPLESFVVNAFGMYCALNDNRIAFINIGAGQTLPSFSNPVSGNGSIARITNSVGNNVYASTTNGKLVSLNGTNTIALNNVDFPPIKGFDFYDEKNGIFITADRFIRRTSDGGAVWQTVLPDMASTATWNGVTLINSQEALIYGNNGYLGHQTALGVPVTVNTSLSASINEIKMKNNLEGLVVCGTGLRKVNRSNSGSIFQLSSINTLGLGSNVNVTDLHLFNNGSAVVLGGTNAYYITAPNGNSATAYQLNLGTVSGTLNDVYFHDDRTGYIVGDDGLALRCNYAQNLEVLSQSDIQAPVWAPINLKDPYSVYTTSSAPGIDLKSVAFSDRHNGIFAGANGNGSPASKYIMKVKDEINYFSTRFWYDGLGRLIVSQNSKQFDQGTYSYTRYDHLGRIIESGEKTENVSGTKKFFGITGSDIFGYFNMRTMDYTKFEAWISDVGARKEVTYTVYDEPISTPPGNQDNLRNRVASIFYFDTWEPTLTDYQFASHFSYDIHGNVKELWQENRHQKGILTNQDFKHIKYKYDLISGKVNKVMYQPGASDAFYHKYLYDGDNRIVEVFTSRDDIVWESDARYFYYDHGPLARVELGDNNVQGVDYAYTLQGWIKGINSTTLDASRDMGIDGNRSPSNVHQDFARDICSYSLSYFENDYLPIGQELAAGNAGGTITIPPNLTPSTSFLADLNGSSSTPTPSDLELEGGSLYNGNIRSMVTTLPVTASIQPNTGLSYSHQVQGFGYRYDVLNRISSAVGYRNIDMLNNYWKKEPTPAKQYSTGYTYDANGNILTLDRADESNAKFDQFAYKYQTSSTGKLLSNRLYHVNDNPGYTSLMDDDIDDQGAYSATSHNYEYDKIGNLIHDEQEEIEDITWTVTGKVKSILRQANSTKPDLEFFYDAQGNRLRKVVKPAGSTVNNGGEDLTENWTTTDYVRDPQGNIMATYEGKYTTVHQYSLKERYLYGSSRLGIDYHEVNMYQALPVTPALQIIQPMEKQFEISNHLGNVLATVSNYAIAVPDGNGGIDHYEPEVVNTSDYYPFGSLLKERTCRWVWKKGANYNSDPTHIELAFVNMTEDPNNIAIEGSRYRFSFNGKESDSEVKGEGNSLDFGARMYDSRSGKWLAIDPLSSRFPYSSTYAYCENSPLFFIDPDGRSIKPSTGEARVAIQAQLDNFNQNTTLAQIFGNTNYGRIGRFNDPNNQSNLRQNQQVNGFSLVGMNYATAKRILENDKTGLTVEQKLQALAWLRALSAMDIAEIAIFNNTQVTPNVNPNIGQGNGITDNSLITTNQAIPTFLTAIATVLGNPVQQDNLINGFEASATGSNGVPFLPASPLPTGELPANLQNDSNQALRIIGLYPIANTASNPATTADLLRAVVNFGVMSGPIKINEGSSQSEMQSNGTVTTTPR
jgi:RHS repeat-associated protein